MVAAERVCDMNQDNADFQVFLNPPMAARKLSSKTRSNMTGVPKRSSSGILPNLPIKFSEGLLANAKPRSLTEREVPFEAGDAADGCY